MISMKEKQEIIIGYYRNGDSQRQIAKALNISRTTVGRYIREYEQSKEQINSSKDGDEILIEELVKAPRYNSKNRGKRKLTSEVIDEIDKLLKLNEQKKAQGLHKQVLKKIDILEYLQEKGFDIGYTSVCNYISEKTSKSKEAYIRQVYAPGDVCEFDWGEVKLNIDEQPKILNMAVFTPANSNYRYAILFYRQDSTSFQQAHVNFFEHVGGVYRTLVYDNMRVAIKRFVGINEKEPTEALLKLSMYYQFHFRFCNIRKGNEKGHVERSVEYVRRKAFAVSDSFTCLEKANQWLEATCNRINNKGSQLRKSESPALLFNREKAFLLPAAPRFDCAIIDQCRVDKYSTISFATNRYSVPDHLVGQIIDLKVYPEKVVCYHHNIRICQHERIFGRHAWQINLEHYLRTLQCKPGALAGSRALQAAPVNVKSIYDKYFKNKAKQFIELLLFIQENQYEFTTIEKAIRQLNKICPHDISADKIKAVALQKQDPPHNKQAHNDSIATYSNEQLKEYCSFLN